MYNMIKEVSTNEVFQLLGKPGTKIIDIRPIDAYNGWCLQNESRCGHIKDAKSLPAKWIEYIDWIEIIRAKKILTQHNIVVYGYYYAESEKVAKAFLHAGYNDVSIYNQFITEWSSNIGLPMQHLERFPQLVYPHWIQTLISGGTPPHYNNSKFVICHAHYRNRDAYLGGHIPGAITGLKINAVYTDNNQWFSLVHLIA